MPHRAVTLSGKRVSLRPPVMADYDEFTALMRKSRRVNQRFLDFPFKGRKQFADIYPAEPGRRQIPVCDLPQG